MAEESNIRLSLITRYLSARPGLPVFGSVAAVWARFSPQRLVPIIQPCSGHLVSVSHADASQAYTIYLIVQHQHSTILQLFADLDMQDANTPRPPPRHCVSSVDRLVLVTQHPTVALFEWAQECWHNELLLRSCAIGNCYCRGILASSLVGHVIVQRMLAVHPRSTREVYQQVPPHWACS